VKRGSIFLLILAGLLVAAALAAASAAQETPATIPPGVTIGAVAVGDLTPETAAEAVLQAFQTPLELELGATRILVTPDVLGAAANIDRAIERALVAAPDTAIPLGVALTNGKIADFVQRLADRYDRAAVDSKLSLRRLRPWLSSERIGRKLDKRRAIRDIATALTAGRHDPLPLFQKRLRPQITRRNFGPVIVIRRGSNQLFLYDGMRYRRMFRVATGQRQYPTPLGRFTIVVKWRNPWWYPPKSPWAEGQEPIPPGPDNPLGTRWLGLSAPGVGIHGTPSDSSIGYSVSHGCIRMHISQAEWLFNHVGVGTTVFIVAA
jgi:lipoprotein-anchoring transpeptidase ErfK/SrfK